MQLIGGDLYAMYANSYGDLYAMYAKCYEDRRAQMTDSDQEGDFCKQRARSVHLQFCSDVGDTFGK
eukprot:3626354-Rhodomonas_salina.1